MHRHRFRRGQHAGSPPPWLFVVLAGLAAAVPAAGQNLAAFERRTTVHKLANGWTFIIVERPGAPVFSFCTVADVGSGADGAHVLARRVERHEHLARLAVLDQLDAPEAALPRTSPIDGWRSCSARSSGPSTSSPMLAAFSTMPSSLKASIEATAAAQASGWPEYVRPPG